MPPLEVTMVREVSAAPSARAGVRGTAGAAVDSAVLAAVERAAGIPRGLALLHRSPLECAAVLVGVHPLVVERARAVLDDRERRAGAIAAFVRAAHDRRQEDAHGRHAR